MHADKRAVSLAGRALRAQLVAAKSLLPAFADGPRKSALRIGARANTTCEAKQRIAAVSSQVHLGN